MVALTWRLHWQLKAVNLQRNGTIASYSCSLNFHVELICLYY